MNINMYHIELYSHGEIKPILATRWQGSENSAIDFAAQAVKYMRTIGDKTAYAWIYRIISNEQYEFIKQIN